MSSPEVGRKARGPFHSVDLAGAVGGPSALEGKILGAVERAECVVDRAAIGARKGVGGVLIHYH
eukprot:6617649-Pyramimonas_sp.AAC.1